MSKLTVTIPDDLHQKIREELERQGITTSQFIEQAVTTFFEKPKGVSNMATRTLAFQVSEELLQRIKTFLARYEQIYHRKLSQKEFLVHLIERELDEAEKDYERIATEQAAEENADVDSGEPDGTEMEVDGSNLNFDQMAYRCPEATVVGTAKLDGYELAFRRGYLTILPKEGASVEGLIWSVTDHDESQLDCYEGYPTFYDKETMTVTDADGTPHEIMVYTMNAPYRDQLLPVSSRYNAVVMQECLDAGISPQQFYDADEKYRKAYKARAAPVPKKHAPER